MRIVDLKDVKKLNASTAVNKPGLQNKLRFLIARRSPEIAAAFSKDVTAEW